MPEAIVNAAWPVRGKGNCGQEAAEEAAEEKEKE